MPFKDPNKRREYARHYYSRPEQKEKKKAYDRERYGRTRDRYKKTRAEHTYPHRFVYKGDWTCSVCGAMDDLVIHHINGDHHDNDASNLQCLCRSCHARHHIGHRERASNGQVMTTAPKTI